jgi:hypothetical protein
MLHALLKTHLGKEIEYRLPKGKPTFNRTNDHVDWAAWTWNPVTGCLHNCRYCYAREIAETNPNLKEFYPAGFTPLFHHERLDAPANTKVPNARNAANTRRADELKGKSSRMKLHRRRWRRHNTEEQLMFVIIEKQEGWLPSWVVRAAR